MIGSGSIGSVSTFHSLRLAWTFSGLRHLGARQTHLATHSEVDWSISSCAALMRSKFFYAASVDLTTNTKLLLIEMKTAGKVNGSLVLEEIP